jgi:hypothetical protein
VRLKRKSSSMRSKRTAPGTPRSSSGAITKPMS